ncbi:hypothetical protein C8Q76DRAFT_799196 [Earliella scabrosa]|nr:hypothetical protein C8Q76DRAFT_799196 [Earliella scabrosa]
MPTSPSRSPVLIASNPMVLPSRIAASSSTVHAPREPTKPLPELPLVPRVQLRVTREGKARPGEVGSFDGLVAGPGFSATSAFTTPNATWVPRFAIAHSEITTHTDGRWGRHEYSRWPQEFTREAFYIHCIPTSPSHPSVYSATLPSGPTDPPDGPGDVLWSTLHTTDWVAVECGMPGVGTLTPALESELAEEVSKVVARYGECENHDGWNDIGSFLVVCVQHALDRLRALPAVPGVIIALAAHVQRLALELWGMVLWLEVVLPRVQKKQDCRTRVLDVLGAHTPDPSIAQMLHYAGVPLWFQQPITGRLAVYKVVELTELPSDFSTTPSFPRLLLAKRDLSGALNMPGEWRRAMTTIVQRQLCVSRLPALLGEERDEERDEEPPAKRVREGVLFVGEDSPSAGPAAPVFVLRAPRSVKTLGHGLPPQPGPPTASSSKPSKQPTRRARERNKRLVEQRAAGRPVDHSLLHPPTQKPHPARVFYPSDVLAEPAAWSRALHSASPLPEPCTSVRYYLAPPWMLDSLRGYEPSSKRTARYLLQWLSIRTFCRLRLFDQTVAGRPLTILEWRDSLWGDYKRDQPTGPGVGRQKARREQQLSIRSLLGKLNALPSYCPDITAFYGNVAITHEVLATNNRIRARVAWDAYETNWRCELLALDALMVGSNDWPELDRWMRESLVAKVWGGTSGLDIVPHEARTPVFCWRAPPEDGWQECVQYLQAFVDVLLRWPGCPDFLQHIRVANVDDVTYNSVTQTAVGFYVSTFITKYHRLPVPPVHFPNGLTI